MATLGGLTGLAGLPGLLADTLWLLLVSLRTVYQLGAIYNKPLTGKQGVKMAYELLASADLSKMQEKQALLAGIGIGKGLLDNAQSNGLHNELKNLGLKNKNVNFYAEQVDNIASQVGINLDNINLSWVRRFLPATAVIVGMRYNSQLIDEVIGVAQATFAPEAKLANRAITDDSSSEAQVKKNTDSKNEEQSPKSDNAKKDTDKADDNKSKAENNKSKTDNDKSKADQTESEIEAASEPVSKITDEESVDENYKKAQTGKKD